MHTSPDYSVYLVTDRPLCLGRDLFDVVRQAIAGGTTMVQLREKDSDTREFVELARAVHDVTRPLGIPLFINDRIDVALACGAEGVHVGQTDMHPRDVRALIGDDMLLGLSIDTREQVREAEDLPVDYLGIGPVFATKTKACNCPEWGLDGLREVKAMSRHPLVGIGGVNEQNAADIIRAGAVGIAVVSNICSADSPEAASRALVEAVRQGREG